MRALRWFLAVCAALAAGFLFRVAIAPVELRHQLGGIPAIDPGPQSPEVREFLQSREGRDLLRHPALVNDSKYLSLHADARALLAAHPELMTRLREEARATGAPFPGGTEEDAVARGDEPLADTADEVPSNAAEPVATEEFERHAAPLADNDGRRGDRLEIRKLPARMPVDDERDDDRDSD